MFVRISMLEHISSYSLCFSKLVSNESTQTIPYSCNKAGTNCCSRPTLCVVPTLALKSSYLSIRARIKATRTIRRQATIYQVVGFTRASQPSRILFHKKALRCSHVGKSILEGPRRRMKVYYNSAPKAPLTLCVWTPHFLIAAQAFCVMAGVKELQPTFGFLMAQESVLYNKTYFTVQIK